MHINFSLGCSRSYTTPSATVTVGAQNRIHVLHMPRTLTLQYVATPETWVPVTSSRQPKYTRTRVLRCSRKSNAEKMGIEFEQGYTSPA
jgi:hypothetical protein